MDIKNLKYRKWGRDSMESLRSFCDRKTGRIDTRDRDGARAEIR